MSVSGIAVSTVQHICHVHAFCRAHACFISWCLCLDPTGSVQQHLTTPETKGNGYAGGHRVWEALDRLKVFHFLSLEWGPKVWGKRDWREGAGGDLTSLPCWARCTASMDSTKPCMPSAGDEIPCLDAHTCSSICMVIATDFQQGLTDLACVNLLAVEVNT